MQGAAAPAAGRILQVGTKLAAPFAFKTDSGKWRGITIDLWRRIAADAGLRFEFKEKSLGELIQGLQDGKLDAVAAALTVTPEREAVIDFSHPFYPSGLGIAVPATKNSGVLAAFRGLFSWQFVQGVGALVLVIFIVGVLLWWFERRANAEQFGGTKRAGIASGFWWSAVTMTTVGYGDKSPVTPGGRLVALVWMFIAIVSISGFTAAIASALTLNELDSEIMGPGDLGKLRRVFTIKDSTSERYLTRSRVASRAVTKPTEALEEIAAGRGDAFVYDAPILRYRSKTQFLDSVTVLPITFDRQDYAIGLPLDSKLRKTINGSLLRILSTPEWQDTLFRYLGE